jgi:M6 family metalloprotease-like protein
LKRLVGVLALLLVVISLTPSFGASPKPGSSCSKVGAVTISSGMKYTCVKSGSKKVWNKGALVSKPVTQTLPVTEISGPNVLLPISDCKLRTADPVQRHFASGFPLYPERMNLLKNPTVQVLAVDFPDVPGVNPKKDLSDVTSYISKYYQTMSTNPISIEWRVPETYLRLPKKVLDYKLNANFFDDSVNVGQVIDNYYWPYVRAVIAAYDPVVDFTGVETIVVAGPPGIKDSQIGMFIAQAAEPGQGFSTSEGTIYNVLIRGNDENRRLLNWTHEFTHMLGLTDTRNTTSRQNQLNDGLGQFDLMSGEGAVELLAWHRFMLGILNDDQIRCTNSPLSTHLIQPVESKTTKVKSVVIPITTTTGIAIESRRAVGYDTWLGSKANEGIMVMTIDTKIGYGYSPFKIAIGPNTTDTFGYKDALLQVGESVTANGYKITFVETGAFGDVVKVEKVT